MGYLNCQVMLLNVNMMQFEADNLREIDQLEEEFSGMSSKGTCNYPSLCLLFQGNPGAEKGVVFYMDILKSIIQGLLTAQEKLPAGDSKPSQWEKEFLQLDTSPARSHQENLRDTYRLLLQHPAFRNVFLSKEDCLGSPAKELTVRKRLVELLSPHLTEILRVAAESYKSDLEEYLDIYTKPLEADITSLLVHEADSSSCNAHNDKLALTMSKVEAFLPYFAPETLLKLCELLLSDHSVVVSEPDHISARVCSDILFRAMRLLCKEENRAVLTQARLTYQSATKFFQQITKMTDQPSAVSDAVKLLQVAPCYASCIDRSFLFHCLNVGGIHWVALAVCCMKHSATCCLWFESWCKQFLKAKKKKKMDYMPAVRQYLVSGGSGEDMFYSYMDFVI